MKTLILLIKNNMQTFKGFANGRYYDDWIIKEAKEAMNNPDWKDKFIQKKKTVSDSLKTWQDTLDTGGENENMATRVILGICSLGISEIGFGALGILEDKNENKRIDETINKIRNCMEDLWREKNS